MQKNKTLCFEVDADNIKIKKLLKKDFLELSMRAISDINPNVNGSHFTLSGMEKSLPTFKNKPILGYFTNGDFVAHDGVWRKDSETDLDYWDTLGERGERILGLIRDEDNVEIVEDKKTGLHWITLTCALWVQYSYKQVKRLLKDALASKKKGGPTKNISVEIDILDYEELPNGIIEIKDFNLVGITILGSRNGKKVEPGIPDAELSVVEMMDKEVFNKQAKALRVAYSKLENLEGGHSQMEKENENVTKEDILETDNSLVKTPVSLDTFEKDSEEKSDSEEDKEEHKDEEKADYDQDDNKDEVDSDSDDDKDEDDSDEEGKEKKDMSVDVDVVDVAESEKERNADVEVTYCISNMVQDIASRVECIQGAIEYYSEENIELTNKELVIAILKRYLLQEKALLVDLSSALADITEEQLKQALDMEQELSRYENGCKDLLYKCHELETHCDELQMSCNEKESQCTMLKSQCEELNCKYDQVCHEKEEIEIKLLGIHSIECEKQIKDMLNEADIPEQSKIKILEGIKKDEHECYSSSNIEEVKTEIGKVMFELSQSKNKPNKVGTVFDAPVITPKTSGDLAEKSTPKSNWEVLADYNDKR